MLLGTHKLHKNFACSYSSLVQILVIGLEQVGKKFGKHFGGPGEVRVLRICSKGSRSPIKVMKFITKIIRQLLIVAVDSSPK